jgi:branched-chain amino acid transport system permease protein
MRPRCSHPCFLMLSFAQFLDLLVGGVAIGCVYSLVALGFAMIMRATNIIHFAQGEVMMLGAMCALTSLWLIPALALVGVLTVAMLSSGIVAMTMELAVYRTLRRRRVGLMNVITATVGMSILCMNAARLIWGSEPLRFPELFASQAYSFAGLRISAQLFWVMVMGIAIMLALQLFLNHTRTGILMQAMAQDAEAAQLMGANETRMTAYTFGLAGLMAGAAGVMLGSMFFAFFEMGFITGLKGFVAAILGGIGSITGAMLGGILFGLLETFSAVFLSSAYKDGIGMLLLIAILLFLPDGLVGLWQRRS